MNRKRRNWMTVLGSLLFAAQVHAATPPATPAAGPAPGVDPELDEVIVNARGDSLSSLRLALVEAEDRFYERWNALNEEDSLDVLCRFEAPLGSNIKRRYCIPRVVDEANRDRALGLFSLNDIGGTISLPSTGNIREAAAREMKRRTLPLLESDPELRQALLERAKLQQLFDTLRREKMRGRLVVWD